MSNSFNISVKPEIAALVVKVDSIKADTGPIRNDVTSIHDINLPAVKADTGAIRNDVTAIHDTNLPAVKTDTGAIRNDVTDIHDTNLPAVKTDTGAIRNDVTDIKDTELPAAVTKIDNVKTVVDAVQAKTDLIPFGKSQLKLSRTYDNYTTSWGTAFELTGPGILYNSWMRSEDQNFNYRITIDSLVLTFSGLIAATEYDVIRNITHNVDKTLDVVTPIKASSECLDYQFLSLLKIEIQMTASTAAVNLKIIYGDG